MGVKSGRDGGGRGSGSPDQLHKARQKLVGTMSSCFTPDQV